MHHNKLLYESLTFLVIMSINFKYYWSLKPEFHLNVHLNPHNSTQMLFSSVAYVENYSVGTRAQWKFKFSSSLGIKKKKFLQILSDESSLTSHK